MHVLLLLQKGGEGKFGKAFYFAKDVTKCHKYNKIEIPPKPHRFVFYCQVVMGISERVSYSAVLHSLIKHREMKKPLSPTAHSVIGRFERPNAQTIDEYVVYEYGRGIPIALVKYLPK